MYICNHLFFISGDRTKHLKNLHGVIKKQEPPQQNGVNITTSTVANISNNTTSASGGINIIHNNSTSLSPMIQTTVNNLSENTTSISGSAGTTFINNSNLLSRSAVNNNTNIISINGSSSSNSLSNSLHILSSGTEDRLISSLSSSDTASFMELDHSLTADPLDIGGNGGSSSPPRLLGGCTSLPGQETVSMSLDDVLQYAQPVADFSF